MAVEEPFIRWLFVKHPLKFCRNGGFFYMETGRGARVIVAAAVDNGANHLYYRAASTFVASYRGILPLGIVFRWGFRKDVIAWLNSVVYHSFVRYSGQNIGRCWYVLDVPGPEFTGPTTFVSSQTTARDNHRLGFIVPPFQMSSHICPVKDITLASKRYTIQVMVIEKGMPRTASKNAKPYQRILLQDAKGTKIQGTIFGEDIAILSNTLKMFQTYAISNAMVDRLDSHHRFVEHCFQLKISARTPIQAKLIDGLTIRTLKFSFTPIADVAAIEDVEARIDMIFAILEVGTQKPAGKTMVADLRIIDQGLVPTNVTLWDQFSDTEAAAMSTLPGPFPIAIAYRLKLASKYGTNLGTRNSSTFIFNPPIPEAAALQAWCKANATAIKELPTECASRYRTAKQIPPPDNKLVKIANIPASVAKPVYIGVRGTVQLVDFNQKFVYVACSVCNRGTNATGDGEFSCNHCDQTVQPITRVKFEIEIKDPTGQISAAIFSEQIEEFYKISSAEIIDNILDDFLQLPMMEKLNEMRHCRANLKVYNYSYGAISQCKFNIVSIFHDTAESTTDAPRNPQLLPPTTPMKKAKLSNYAESSSPTDNQKQDSDESEAMEDTSDCEDTDDISKKNE